ncbi:hypothetical protein AV955_gp106 [Diadromus pulchellus ascovirus 4a]|uniref:Complete DpAV4 genome n=1 Tax=Diadromus pulchellus ascovirus 4a TaxID=158683 RepID=F2NZ35_9VIRU|nr:hypothetical protein AV955_gp106 [Diadromus pulchellus ascovirus 4a]CCA61463.1 unnamed protein product [Diadromus pulchellus ascovirus 4a]
MDSYIEKVIDDHVLGFCKAVEHNKGVPHLNLYALHKWGKSNKDRFSVKDDGTIEVSENGKVYATVSSDWKTVTPFEIDRC